MNSNYYRVTQSQIYKLTNKSLLYLAKDNKELSEMLNVNLATVDNFLIDFYDCFYNNAHKFINNYIDNEFKDIIKIFNTEHITKVKSNDSKGFYYLEQTNEKYKNLTFLNFGEFLDYCYEYNSKIIYKEDKSAYFSTMEEHFSYYINNCMEELFNYSIKQSNIKNKIHDIKNNLNYSIFEHEIKEIIRNKKIGIEKQIEKIQGF
jgi:hypothetical protein